MNPSLVHLIRSLTEHGASYPGEKTACDQTIHWIEKHQQYAFVRENLEGHITGSILITNTQKTKVLLMFHKKLQKWLQFGGHSDGDMDVRAVAIREFHEESGIMAEPKVSYDPIGIDIHTIPARVDEPDHLHFDIQYLGIIPDDIPFSRQESEVDDIRWFDIEGIESVVSDVSVLSMIQKIKSINYA